MEPAEFESIIEQELFTGQLPPSLLSQWKEAYQRMITKAIFNTGGTRYIGKNPCHLTRTGLLKEMYPVAKFIFIHRHPYDVIESLFRFMQSIFPGVQLHELPPGFSRENVILLYKRVMDAYFHDRSKIPGTDLIELKMDDFTRDIPGHLIKIYEKFGLGDFRNVAHLIDHYISENPPPVHPVHSPTKEAMRLVDQHAGDILNQLGYGGTNPVFSTGEKPANMFVSDSTKNLQQVS
jgi:hypothetical protein